MIYYYLKMILCSGAMLLVYSLLFERVKMHRFNRLFLLFALLFSFVVPLIVLRTTAPALVMVGSGVLPAEALSHAVAVPAVISMQKGVNLLPFILSTVYLGIAVFLLIGGAKNIYILLQKVKSHDRIPYQGATIVLTGESVVPYSFLNCIFLNKSAYENGEIEKEVLAHELTHVRDRHSLDVLIVSFIQAVCWLNPFFFFYRKAIQLNHEFLADESVLTTYGNIKAYQRLLLDKSNLERSLLLTSRFNFLITRKRLSMMNETTSRKAVIVRKCILLPVLAGLVFMFSTKISAQDTTASPAKPDQRKAISIDTGNPTGPVQEGVSEKGMDAYHAIENKHRYTRTSGHPGFTAFSEGDRSRMEPVYKSMSPAQKSTCHLIFLPHGAPLPRVVPTEKQFTSFKDPRNYGVWINEKKVDNAALDHYQASDFAQVFISRLEGGARRNAQYNFQVDLMTKEYYADYYKTEIANQKYLMAYVLALPVDKTGKVKRH